MEIIKKEIPRNILLVLNNLNERNNLSSRLRTQGFHVECASGGFHALHLIENHPYHLAIIVQNMHDMPGGEIISLLRNAKNQKELPVLFLSKRANADEMMELMALGATCQEYTQNFQAILETINKLCPPIFKK